MESTLRQPLLARFPRSEDHVRRPAHCCRSTGVPLRLLAGKCTSLNILRRCRVISCSGRSNDQITSMGGHYALPSLWAWGIASVHLAAEVCVGSPGALPSIFPILFIHLQGQVGQVGNFTILVKSMKYMAWLLACAYCKLKVRTSSRVWHPFEWTNAITHA